MSEKVYRFQPRIDGVRQSFTFTSKRERDEFMRDFKKRRRENKAGLPQKVRGVSFEAFAKEWLQEQRLRVKDSNELTLAGWAVFERHLRIHAVPEIGHVPMSKFNVFLLEEFFKKLRSSGKSPQTVNRVRSTLGSLFKEAARRQLLPANPISVIPKLKEKRKEREILDTPQQIVAWLREAAKEGPMWFTAEMILLNTGMRRSNLIALQWRDWKEAERIITISRLWEQESRTIVDRVKGRDDGYLVGVNDALTWALSEWRKVSKFTRPNDFIITTEDGRHIDSKSLDARHNRIRRATGLNVVVHGLRHTRGTYMADKAGLAAAKEALGHKSQTTTEQFYLKRLTHRLVEQANKVNFSPTEPEEKDEP